MVSAFPEWWRSKFQGLRTISLPPQLPLMDGDIADLEQKADELMTAAEGVFADLDEWVWSHELTAAWYRLKALSLICDTEITATFDATEALFVAGFREDFHAWWAEAGRTA